MKAHPARSAAVSPRQSQGPSRTGRAVPGSRLESCLAELGRVRFKVTGSCMGRALPPGTEVVVASRALREPRLGDVVLVRQPGGLQLHRLVLAWRVPGGPRWRTKADGNARWDAPVKREQVLGTVVWADGPREGAARRAWRAVAGLAKGFVNRLARGPAGAPA